MMWEGVYDLQEILKKKSRILSGGGLGVSPSLTSPPRVGDLGGWFNLIYRFLVGCYTSKFQEDEIYGIS
jgi:hypothetical protein